MSDQELYEALMERSANHLMRSNFFKVHVLNIERAEREKFASDMFEFMADLVYDWSSSDIIR